MTTFYSEHYSARIGSSGHFTTKSTPSPILSAGEKHGRKRHTIARLQVPSGTDFATGDIVRLFDIKSGDRPLALFLSCDADFATTSTVDIGIYKKGADDAGAVVDADVFGSAVDLDAGIARVDQLIESGVVTNFTRGKPAWALVGAGATYTEDPKEAWTVALTFVGNPAATAAAADLQVELEYLAGD